jgi:hypothetical protein
MQGFYDPHTPSDERFWYGEDFDLEVGLLTRDVKCGAIAFPCKPLDVCNWASTTGIKLPPAFITALTPKAPKTRGDRARRLDAVGRAARCLAEKARSQNAPFALTSIPCTKATFICLLKALERRELGPFSDSSFDTYFDDLKMKFLPGRRKGHHDQQFEKLFPELKVG